jgi:ubiquinone/menaquinone biosynthesis C-methylase UbiE
MPLDQPRSKNPTVELARPRSPGAHFGIPRYLVERYWWAYLHPAAIGFFDRPWIVNLILWGNYERLCRAAFEALGAAPLDGRTLQVACVYGDLTVRLADRLAPTAALQVIDVVPRQLARLQAKLARRPNVALKRSDSAAIRGADGGFDRALIFFLLHEQPEAVRRATLREVARVVRPGGQVVIVDYHRPRPFHPLRYLMRPILAWLEPFALDLWRHELDAWLPKCDAVVVRRQLFFGGLYQLMVLAVGPPGG